MTTVEITITDQMAACIDRLIDIGIFGNTRAEVALYLVIRGLEDLGWCGVLQITGRQP